LADFPPCGETDERERRGNLKVTRTVSKMDCPPTAKGKKSSYIFRKIVDPLSNFLIVMSLEI
jgi:hypothetical protein